MTPRFLIKRRKKNSPVSDELKKHLTERYWTGVTGTNKVLIAWTTTLFITFITYIVPLPFLAKNYLEAREAKQQSQLKLQKQSGKLISEKYNEPTLTNERLTEKNALQAEVPDLKLDFDKKSVEKATLLTKASTIKTPLGDINVPPLYQPVLWVCIYLVFLIYFIVRRIKLFSILALIVDINLKNSRNSAEKFKGLGAGAPFWLAPLPKSIKTTDGTLLDYNALQLYLGRKSNERKNSILTLSCLIVSFLLLIWVTISEFLLSKVFYSPQIRFYFLVIFLLVIVVSFITSLFYLSPRIELEEFSTKIDDKNRRNFLLTGGAAVTGSLILLLVPLKALPRVIASVTPRWKRKEKKDKLNKLPESFRNNFWITDKIQKKYPKLFNEIQDKKFLFIHFVGKDGATFRNIKFNPVFLSLMSHQAVFDLLSKPIVERKNIEENQQEEPTSRNELRERNFEAVAVPSVPTQKSDSQNTSSQKTFSDKRNLMSSKPASNYQKPRAAADKKKNDQKITPLAPQVYKSQLSAISECLVLEQLQNGNPSDEKINSALNLLLNTILNSPENRKNPNYRFYDLLAGLAYKYSKPDFLSKLNEHIQNKWSQDKKLIKRTENWKNPSEKWRLRWAKDQPLNWKHPFKNWKKPNQPSNSLYSEFLK